MARNFRIYYDIDTTGGQSGSPIIVNNDVAVGVHTHGSRPRNSGNLITPDRFNLILDRI